MDQFPENDCNGKKTMEKDDDTVVSIKTDDDTKGLFVSHPDYTIYIIIYKMKQTCMGL
jgi:hypothetical protein